MPFLLRMTYFIVTQYRRLEHNRFIVVVMDFVLLSLAVYVGFALRFSLLIPNDYVHEMLNVMVIYSMVIIFTFYISKVYKISWSKSSVEEFSRLFRSYWAATFVFIILSCLSKHIFVPRSSLAVMIFAGITFITTTRVMWRMMILLTHSRSEECERALIVGAGESGTLLARDLIHNNAKLKPIGFIDDDPKLHGRISASLKVLGGKDILSNIIDKELVTSVLIAMPSATGEQISSYQNILKGYSSVKVRVLPSLIELANGNVSTTRLRPLKLEDLLRREPIVLDNSAIKSIIKDKTVLVTGAGGSIGSEICRQVLMQEPKELLALGHGEQSIYLLTENLSELGNTTPVRKIIADVADRDAMERVFMQYRPQAVFHAGAHKHVPLMEDNPRESLRVNSYGTWNLAELCGRYNVQRMVMISTDKAVHPTSIMGATKRIAEKLLLSVQQEYPQTKYMAVRFGNVLGSRGSVVPKFEKQIEKGGPVTVTHPDMKRYFMLIPEAVSLVLQAGSMGNGGELFVLDMGEPVNIAEMAETLIRLHGHEPYKDIKIEFTGIRPGEKLYEELFYDPDHVSKTTSEKIYLGKFSAEKESLLPRVEKLLADSAGGTLSEAELKAAIFQLGGNGENEAS